MDELLVLAFDVLIAEFQLMLIAGLAWGAWLSFEQALVDSGGGWTALPRDKVDDRELVQ